LLTFFQESGIKKKSKNENIKDKEKLKENFVFFEKQPF